MEKVAIDRLELVDLQRHSVNLQDYFQEYSLLIFLRHLAWLPCQHHLGEVKSAKSEFDRRGVTIVVISFAAPERLLPYQKHHQWPFVILTDPKRHAYQAFALQRLSLLRVFSPATLRLYFRLLREGKKLQNYGQDDYYQAGGDFLIDRKGGILFAHRSQDPADRPAVSTLLGEIDRFLAASSVAKRAEPTIRSL
jgi:peroxiredoxin